MINIPDNCRGCGKCCTIKYLINNPSIVVHNNFKTPLTFHYGRCMYLNDINECDIYGINRPEPCLKTTKGDNICVYSLQNN